MILFRSKVVQSDYVCTPGSRTTPSERFVSGACGMRGADVRFDFDKPGAMTLGY
jgi:hypothetical protein